MNEFITREFEPTEKDLGEFCDDCGHYGVHSKYDCEKRERELVVTGYMDGEPIVRPRTANELLERALWDSMTPKQREEFENDIKSLIHERD